MNYSEALEFLFNSIPNYQKSGQNALRPGLTNILTLTKHFKNPHKTGSPAVTDAYVIISPTFLL